MRRDPVISRFVDVAFVVVPVVTVSAVIVELAVTRIRAVKFFCAVKVCVAFKSATLLESAESKTVPAA